VSKILYYPVCFCNGRPMVRAGGRTGLWRCRECGAVRDGDPDKAGAWRTVKIDRREEGRAG
jgi:ribosomal protein L37AE/L43A